MELGSLLESILSKYGDTVVKTAISKLITMGKVASSKLKNSLKYDIVKAATGYQLHFTGNSYLKFVEDGRKPNSKQPPISVIQQWMSYKGIRTKNNKGTAFCIARKIGKFGIQPTNFMYESIIQTQNEFKKGMTKELQDYIIRDIKMVIGGSNRNKR